MSIVHLLQFQVPQRGKDVRLNIRFVVAVRPILEFHAFGLEPLLKELLKRLVRSSDKSPLLILMYCYPQFFSCLCPGFTIDVLTLAVFEAETADIAAIFALINGPFALVATPGFLLLCW